MPSTETELEVLKLLAGQIVARPDPDLNAKLTHFLDTGELPPEEAPPENVTPMEPLGES